MIAGSNWLLKVSCHLFDHTESFGDKKAEKVIGILGESVVFSLKNLYTFPQFFWLRTSTGNFAVVNRRHLCELSGVHPELEGRLNVSEDCKSLQITHLRQNDSDTYMAQIQIGWPWLRETFHLQIYSKYLNITFAIIFLIV